LENVAEVVMNIDFDMSDFDDIDEEILDEVTKDLRRGFEAGSTYAVLSSPVVTGRFKGNWSISFDDPKATPLNVFDPEGASTLGRNVADVKKFNLNLYEQLILENTVQNEDTGEYYGPKVLENSEKIPRNWLSKIASTMAEGMN
jgi:hypothetical protein